VVGVGTGLVANIARIARTTMTATAIAMPRVRGATIITTFFILGNCEAVYMRL